MKLRNKKTGEIVEAHEIDLIDNYVYLKIFRAGDYDTKQYNSLAELNDEWEDYEEPEEFWYINECGDVLKYKYDGGCSCPILEAEEIGNRFETKEEAERAVEKLKAWKRLEGKGFRFIDFSEGEIKFELDEEYSEFTYDGYDEGLEFYIDGDVQEDLKLLFGCKLFGGKE